MRRTVLAGSFYVQGTWLEGRRLARMLEWARLGVVGLHILWSREALGGLTPWLLGYLFASASVMLVRMGQSPAPSSADTGDVASP